MASGSSDKEPRHKREKEQFCDDDKTGQEEGEAEESSSCDEDDVWATEDEDNDDNENDTDSSEEEYNASCTVSTRDWFYFWGTRLNFENPGEVHWETQTKEYSTYFWNIRKQFQELLVNSNSRRMCNKNVFIFSL